MSSNQPLEIGVSPVSLDGRGLGYKRIVIPFTTEEEWLKNRIPYVTSSDVPVLFGCGYQSYESLVEHKRNGTAPIVTETEDMRWGKAMEPAIAKEFARRNDWTIRHKTEFIAIPELRLASSFDYEIETQAPLIASNALLEIKLVSEWKYKKDWVTTGFEIEATEYIELQLQNELLVSGLQIGYIGALIGSSKPVLLRREANPVVQQAILTKVKKFWEEVGK